MYNFKGSPPNEWLSGKAVSLWCQGFETKCEPLKLGIKFLGLCLLTLMLKHLHCQYVWMGSGDALNVGFISSLALASRHLIRSDGVQMTRFTSQWGRPAIRVFSEHSWVRLEAPMVTLRKVLPGHAQESFASPVVPSSPFYYQKTLRVHYLRYNISNKVLYHLISKIS